MDCSTDLQNWYSQNAPNELLLKTSWGHLKTKSGENPVMHSKPWMNLGMAWLGAYWTQNTPEGPNDGVECSLSQVMETTAPRECFLKSEYLEKWLARARGHSVKLPANLEAAFTTQMSLLSNTQLTESPLPLIQRELPILYVRRMTDSELERLQGFPENWTILEPEL